MRGVYYNENDPFAVAWLRRLIRRGVIPPGEIDARSIIDVRPSDLDGFRHAHFFAGIGGWPVALALAGWPDDRPVWTASCPCQPFSGIGDQGLDDDSRHLWPAFRGIVSERQPATCFGEQVANPAGRIWLAGIRADLEKLGYGVGAADLCAASVGAPHRRQRLFWLANRLSARLERHAGDGDDGHQPGRHDAQAAGPASPRRRSRLASPGFWDRWEAREFSDGKRRRVEPGLEPLADGLPRGMGGRRVGSLRGYGNAIVPELAAEFIAAAIEII